MEKTITLSLEEYQQMEKELTKTKKDLDQALFSLNEVGHAFRATLGYFMKHEEKTMLLQFLEDKLDQDEWEMVDSLLFDR